MSTNESSVTTVNAAVNGSTVSDGLLLPEVSIRATKRKLDDAFHSLDDAVRPPDSPATQPSVKRQHTMRNLYSVLAKYGIKTKDTTKESTEVESDPLTKNTPHLAAILARTATRTRKALVFKAPEKPTPSHTVINNPAAEYRPSSTALFLSRLATFKLTTYSNKPPSIDAVAAARCGWINDGKDRLLCGICNVSWVVAGREGMTRDAANALIEKQRLSLVNMHKDGCPWKVRQCDASIYCIPLQSPANMARDLKSNALALGPVLNDIEIKHPLTTNQLHSFRSVVAAVDLSPSNPKSSISGGSTPENPDNRPGEDSVFTHSSEPSETAILVSLFGWSPAPPAPATERHRLSSFSRASSVVRNASPTPSLQRYASVAAPDRDAAPTRSTPRPSVRFGSPFSSVSDSSKREPSLLQCVLCQRRVGLWAFAPPSINSTSATSVNDTEQTKAFPPRRPFDLLKEHRSYCPYVVRSTVIPSLPVPTTAPPSTHARSSSSSSLQINGTNNGALEGWRAVLTILLRHHKVQKQRMGILGTIQSASAPSPEDSGQDAEMDGVEAMVAGVKSRGGKELLKYVKGLLG